MAVSAIAQEIFSQMGAGRAMMMIGGNAMSDGDALVIKFKARAKASIKIIKVTLEPSDTYRVDFLTSRGTTVRSVDDVYCDSLTKVIETETGLYLKF